jgi:hypothetical protein
MKDETEELKEAGMEYRKIEEECLWTRLPATATPRCGDKYLDDSDFPWEVTGLYGDGVAVLKPLRPGKWNKLQHWEAHEFHPYEERLEGAVRRRIEAHLRDLCHIMGEGAKIVQLPFRLSQPILGVEVEYSGDLPPGSALFLVGNITEFGPVCILPEVALSVPFPIKVGKARAWYHEAEEGEAAHITVCKSSISLTAIDNCTSHEARVEFLPKFMEFMNMLDEYGWQCATSTFFPGRNFALKEICGDE